MTLHKPRLSDPRRLAGLILVVVAVFVVAVAGTLVAKSRTARVEATGGATSSADLRIKEVELEEVSDGVRWRLRAEEALVFKPEGRTALKKIAVDVFERERSWTIVGEEGDLYEATKNVEIRNNVVLTSSDGLRLETSVLRWQDELPNFQDISTDQAQLTSDDRWKTFFFCGYGFDVTRNKERCPETAAALREIPGLTTAFYSILGPHKHLPAHGGPYKGVLRYHLALKVPGPPDACRIRVGDDVRSWVEGKSLVFDDVNEHEAWNDTDGTRVVLFVDFVRPLAGTAKWVNAAIKYMKSRDEFVQILHANVPKRFWSSFDDNVPRKGKTTFAYPVGKDLPSDCSGT